jgi:hypothetical protein
MTLSKDKGLVKNAGAENAAIDAWNAPAKPVPNRGTDYAGDIKEMDAFEKNGRQGPLPAGLIRVAPQPEMTPEQSLQAWATNGMNRDTPEARQILQELAKGRSAKEIAELGLKANSEIKSAQFAKDLLVSQNQGAAVGQGQIGEEMLKASQNLAMLKGELASLLQAQKDSWTGLSAENAARLAELQASIPELEKIVNQQGAPRQMGAASGKAPVVVKSKAEYDALPKGTPFVNEAGQRGIKP